MSAVKSRCPWHKTLTTNPECHLHGLGTLFAQEAQRVNIKTRTSRADRQRLLHKVFGDLVTPDVMWCEKMQHLDSLPLNAFHTMHSEGLWISGNDIEAIACVKLYLSKARPHSGKQKKSPRWRSSTQNANIYVCNNTIVITVIVIAMPYWRWISHKS